jgi:hypothetical protein
VPRVTSQVRTNDQSVKGSSVAATLLSSMNYPFPQSKRAKRSYPGEAEGLYVAAYLEYLSAFPTKQRAILAWLRPMQKTTSKKAMKGTLPVKKLARLVQKNPYGSYEYSSGMAAFKLWELGRLRQIRKCVHCGTWFYARFSHQLFCNDPVKKCQWNHYHTPESRRKQAKYREQHHAEHRKYQRAYQREQFKKGR